MLGAEATGSGAQDGAQIWRTRPAGNADQASAELGGIRGGSGTGWIEFGVDARAKGTRDWFAEAEGGWSLKVVLKWLSEKARCSAAVVACWWP